MSGPSFTDPVRGLLSQIASVAELEALLYLREHEGEWTVEALSRELRLAVPHVARMLRTLVDLSLVAESGGHFRFAPASPEAVAAVDETARAFRERPVAVVSFVHSRHLEDLRSFSNAFVLRKKGGDP